VTPLSDPQLDELKHGRLSLTRVQRAQIYVAMLNAENPTVSPTLEDRLHWSEVGPLGGTFVEHFTYDDQRIVESWRIQGYTWLLKDARRKARKEAAEAEAASGSE
jgi:hypothetical protein